MTTSIDYTNWADVLFITRLADLSIMSDRFMAFASRDTNQRFNYRFEKGELKDMFEAGFGFEPNCATFWENRTCTGCIYDPCPGCDIPLSFRMCELLEEIPF